MKRLAIAICAVFVLASPLGASDAWLPPAVAEGVSRQLAERMIQVGLAGDDQTAALAAARQAVEGMRQELDAWGVRGVLEKAPRFPELELPASSDRYVDAMTRYTICNAVLFRRFLDPESRSDRNAMNSSTLGLTGVTMAIVRLREPYVGEGGTDATLEAALTRPELEPAIRKVQEDPELLLHAERECRPVVRALVGRAAVER